MNVINISKLQKYNYSIKALGSALQYWHSSKIFSCIGMPKSHDLLLYLDGCNAEYTTSGGNIIKAKSENIVYVPFGSEYKVKFYDFKTPRSNTIGVNFVLSYNNEPFILNKKITVIKTKKDIYKTMFLKYYSNADRLMPNYARMNASLYDILAQLNSDALPDSFGKFNCISKGILYLEGCNAYDISIKEVADMCGVSESYFRRLFKEYSGMSPLEFLITNKIERAKLMLRYNNASISEISDLLGFVDHSYFSKTFKEHTKLTPSQYKNKYNK